MLAKPSAIELQVDRTENDGEEFRTVLQKGIQQPYEASTWPHLGHSSVGMNCKEAGIRWKGPANAAGLCCELRREAGRSGEGVEADRPLEHAGDIEGEFRRVLVEIQWHMALERGKEAQGKARGE